jgi:hypothetical protein
MIVLWALGHLLEPFKGSTLEIVVAEWGKRKEKKKKKRNQKMPKAKSGPRKTLTGNRKETVREVTISAELGKENKQPGPFEHTVQITSLFSCIVSPGN